jgi:hypothetical protein
MENNYAIATFCYGERYYNQTNRFIESLDTFEDKPELFIVTDSPSSILSKEFVKVKHINEYDEKYSTYYKDYYSFDFSVKRFSLLFAFQNGYNKVILTDTDVTPHPPLFNKNSVLNTFCENSIAGQVTYNFFDEKNRNSALGQRFLSYEQKFDVEFDKNLLKEMPEDCIQFIDINNDKKFKFIDTWSECIRIKDSNNLGNAPAGNIDEMCFSALYNNISCVNSSNKSINLLVANHDKWY